MYRKGDPVDVLINNVNRNLEGDRQKYVAKRFVVDGEFYFYDWGYTDPELGRQVYLSKQTDEGLLESYCFLFDKDIRPKSKIREHIEENYHV